MKSHYIDDKPIDASEDSAFEAHRKIADAIVDEIANPSNNGPHRIALVGEWGSGKSTIISFVEEGLQKRDKDAGCKSSSSTDHETTTGQKDASGETATFNTHVICFDMWNHRGDMLQRSFLQRIYKALDADVAEALNARSENSACFKSATEKRQIKAKHEKRDSWLMLGRKINGSYQETVVDSASKTPLTALVSGALSVLMFLVEKAFDILKAQSGQSSFAFPEVVLQILLGLSVLVFVGSLAILVKRAVTALKSAQGTIWQRIKRMFGALVNGRTTQHIETITVSSTTGSIAFNEYLENILSVAVFALNPTRIVIVLDNLDRLNGSQLQEAWNAIRVFDSAIGNDEADGKNATSKPETSSTWLILPISREALITLSGIGPNEISALASGTSLDNIQAPSATLSKLFAIRFDIPRPMEPEWKGFVSGCLLKAFPELCEADEERQFVFSVLDCLPSGRHYRSAREVISLVNEMVSLYRIYGGIPYSPGGNYAESSHANAEKAIDLRPIAIYVFLKRMHENRLNDSVSFDAKMADYCSNVSTREGYGFPRYVVDYDDQLIPLMMMTYGILGSQLAEVAFLSTLLQNREYVDRLDLAHMEETVPGMWDAALNCLKNRAVFGNLATDSTCFFALAQKVLDCTSNDPGRHALISEMAGRLPDVKWPRTENTGETVARLLGSATCTLDLVERAMWPIGEAGSQIGEPNECYVWCGNVIDFYGSAPRTVHMVKQPDVFLRGYAYDFVKRSFERRENCAAAQMVNIDGESAFASVVQGLVADLRKGDLSAHDKQELIDFIGNSPLFRNEGATDTFADGQMLGLTDVGEFTEYLYVAWNIYRRTNSARARAFLNNGFTGPDIIVRQAKAPYQKAALLAFCLDDRLGLSQRFEFMSDEVDFILDEDLSCETIERFAFSSDDATNREYLEMVFENTEEPVFHELRVRAAEVICAKFGDRLDDTHGFADGYGLRS